ncbi:MAG: hypothetical protein KBT53_11000, partial [Porticoccus sp.]|nr:hypothetical protein [Porticoccus sp.]
DVVWQIVAGGNFVVAHVFFYLAVGDGSGNAHPYFFENPCPKEARLQRTYVLKKVRSAVSKRGGIILMDSTDCQLHFGRTDAEAH